jgi:hypothetical protein
VDTLRVECGLTSEQFEKIHDKLLNPPRYEINGQMVTCIIFVNFVGFMFIPFVAGARVSWRALGEVGHYAQMRG